MSNNKTIPGFLQTAVNSIPERTFLRVVDAEDPQKDPILWTYGDLGMRVRQAIRSLQAVGIGPGSRILILAENSPEWQVMALAGQSLRAEVVGLFATLGETEVANIIPRVEPEVIVVSSEEQLAKVLPLLKQLNSPKLLISLDAKSTVSPPCEYRTYESLISEDSISEVEFAELVKALSPKDLFIMIFTSGTTGRFKGVRLSHEAFIESLEGGATTLGLKEDGVGLLTLPFGHVAGQCNFYVALKTKSSLIFCPNRKSVIRALSLGPTYTLLVPYFYERIYREALKNINQYPNLIARSLQQLVAASIRAGKTPHPKATDRLLAWLASRVLGKKIGNKLGGRVRIMVSAGSHPDLDLVGFFRGLGFEFLNYYGMSEACGTIALDSVLDRKKKIGSTGKPWKTVELKIAEDGEILVRGQTLLTGYLDKEDDIEAFTSDGFFRTGDLGELDEEGYLFVTGRKKHLIVLRTGEKVSSEAIELQLNTILSLEGSVLLGNDESFVAAGLFVAIDEIQRLEKQLGPAQLERFYLKKIRNGLDGMMEFSIPEQVFVIPGSPEDYPEIITPTLKIKRPAFIARFRSQIDQIYGH